MLRCYDTPSCFQCDESENKIKSAKDYLLGIIEQVYSNGKFDKEIFEHCLEELCFALETEIPNTEPNIERKKMPHEHVAEWIYRGNTKMIQPEDLI